MSQINITLNTNTVEVNTTNNQIVVTDPTNPTTVNIVQPITTVVEVITSGPQGPPGPQGLPGPSGSINTGSLVTTSSFNAFTSSYNTGSFTGSFSGSLFGTSSFAISSSRAVSSSFATTASFAINSQTSSQTNAVIGFQAATVQQINVGQTNSGDYAYIVRAQELEQSKHTTINIYNNLNFI